VVWDLDNTVWDGVLLEGDPVAVRREIADQIKVLDSRGVLNSVASRNDADQALAQLRSFGMLEYFLAPQVNFGPKADSVREIGRRLNIGLDSIVLVDDDPFERGAVSAALPEVRVIDATRPAALEEHFAVLQDLPVTDESRTRRLMYVESEAREAAEQAFDGSTTEFLLSSQLAFTVRRAQGGDLARAHELTVRTNQLNSTGISYSAEQLEEFRRSDSHELVILELRDAFGSYGVIGLALIETLSRDWTLKMILTSCRVMSRGAGGVFLSHLVERATERGVTLWADFVRTGRNRLMYTMLKFGGFTESADPGRPALCHRSPVTPVPSYVTVSADW
jgi:FkbH-like protein